MTTILTKGYLPVNSFFHYIVLSPSSSSLLPSLSSTRRICAMSEIENVKIDINANIKRGVQCVKVVGSWSAGPCHFHRKQIIAVFYASLIFTWGSVPSCFCLNPLLNSVLLDQFLVATKQLYKSVCPSICPSICPSVRPSVRTYVRR